jgi:membrane protein implicated in regulation of membrane protease activity
MINKLVWKKIAWFLLASFTALYITLLNSIVVVPPLPFKVRFLVSLLYIVASFISGAALFYIHQDIEEEQNNLENQLKNRQEDEKEQDFE